MLTIKRTQIEFFEASKEIESAERLREYFVKTFGELSRQHPERLEVEAIRRSFANRSTRLRTSSPNAAT